MFLEKEIKRTPETTGKDMKARKDDSEIMEVGATEKASKKKKATNVFFSLQSIDKETGEFIKLKRIFSAAVFFLVLIHLEKVV